MLRVNFGVSPDEDFACFAMIKNLQLLFSLGMFFAVYD